MNEHQTKQTILSRMKIALAEARQKYDERKETFLARLKTLSDRLKEIAKEEVELIGTYGRSPKPDGRKELPSRGKALLKLITALFFAIAYVFAASGDYSITFYSLSVFPMSPQVLQFFALTIILLTTFAGRWFVWSYQEETFLRSRSYFAFRMSREASRICVVLALLSTATLGAVRGIIMGTNVAMRFGWTRKYPLLALGAQFLLPVLMMLLAVVLGAVLIFAFEYFMENLTKGLRLFLFHVRKRRTLAAVDRCNANLRKNDARLKKKEVVAREEAKIQLETITADEKRKTDDERRKREDEERKKREKEEERKKKSDNHDSWHVDPRKVKSNGSATKATVTVIAAIALASGGLAGCMKAEVEHKISKIRTPFEITALDDFSSSQADQLEANKAVVVAIAEALGSGDHFRVLPIDMASEGRNETLIDISIPDSGGAMDFDLLAARNEARDKADDLFLLYAHRKELDGGTSIIGALNTAGVLDSSYTGHRRILTLHSDLEEASWEVDLYKAFDAAALVDSLAQAGRIPDLHDRELWVVGSTDAHVGPRHQQDIKKFWTLFAHKAGCKSFRWFGYDRALFTTEITKILREGQPEETF